MLESLLLALSVGLIKLRVVSVAGLIGVNTHALDLYGPIPLTPSIALLVVDLEASPLMATLAGVLSLPGYI
jgi:hypothetical protein